MVDEIIKASIVFGSPGGIAGSVGAPSAARGGDATGLGKTMNFAVTLPITDVLNEMAKGISKLVTYSPLLEGEAIKFRKSMQLILMPIGNAIATSIRPFADVWLKTARQFYVDYQNGGLIAAFGGAIVSAFMGLGFVDEQGNITFTGILDNMDEITELTGILMIATAAVAGGIAIGALVVQFIKGLTLMSGGQLALAGMLFIANAELAEGGMETLIGNLAIAGVVWGPGYLKIAGVVVLGAMWADNIEIGDSAEVRAAAEAAGEEYSYTFNDVLKQGINDLWDSLFNSDEDTIISGVNDDVEALNTKIDETPSIWEKAWNGIKDALGLTVEPALDNMSTQLDTNNEKVMTLSNNLTALPNIDRTITYTIKYKRE